MWSIRDLDSWDLQASQSCLPAHSGPGLMWTLTQQGWPPGWGSGGESGPWPICRSVGRKETEGPRAGCSCAVSALARARFPVQVDHKRGFPSVALLARMDCPQKKENPGGIQEENRTSEATGGNCGQRLRNGRMGERKLCPAATDHTMEVPGGGGGRLDELQSPSCGLLQCPRPS